MATIVINGIVSKDGIKVSKSKNGNDYLSFQVMESTWNSDTKENEYQYYSVSVFQKHIIDRLTRFAEAKSPVTVIGTYSDELSDKGAIYRNINADSVSLHVFKKSDGGGSSNSNKVDDDLPF